MSEMPKSNACQIIMVCTDDKSKECVYYSENDDQDGCRYADGLYCLSAVAKVNKLTTRLEQLKKPQKCAVCGTAISQGDFLCSETCSEQFMSADEMLSTVSE